MFIELTDDELGRLTLINVDDIRSVYESNSNKDNAVIYFRSGPPALTATESYAEVVTMIKNATEPAEVMGTYETDFSFIPSANGYRNHPSTSSLLNDMLEEDNDDEKLPWER